MSPPLPSSTSSYRNTQNSASSTLPIFGDNGNTRTLGGLSILCLYKKNILVIVILSVLSLLVFQLKVQSIEFRSVVDKQQCIFILATPGSGYSTMVNLLQNCIPGCQISGENHGAIQSLRGFYQQVVQTNDQPRPSKHAEEAWKKYFKLLDVQEATKSLATTMLNPNKSQCWGFKEIRYGRDNQRLQLGQDIKFLSSLCPNPKIILHTKRNPVLEFNSTVLLGRPHQHELSKLQHQSFDSYVEKEDKPAKVFRHYLEDYLERNTSFQQLWDYLECSLPVNQTTVKIVSERKGHPIAQPIKAR